MNPTTTTGPQATSANAKSGHADKSETASHSETSSMAKEKLSMAATSAAETAREYGSHFVAEPAKDIVTLLQDYARAKPDIAAMWCFGLGVIVGWKLRH
jgi:hypothetical protein